MLFLKLYLAVGLLGVGLYFTGCHQLGLKNGWKMDLLASISNLFAWPVVAYLAIKNYKNL